VHTCNHFRVKTVQRHLKYW